MSLALDSGPPRRVASSRFEKELERSGLYSSLKEESMSWLEPLLPSIVSFPLSFPLCVPKLRLFLRPGVGRAAEEDELKLVLQMFDAPCHLFRLLDEAEVVAVLRPSLVGGLKDCEKPDMVRGRGCDEKDEDIIDQCTDMLATKGW